MTSYHLIRDEDESEIIQGMKLKDFRGKEWTFLMVTKGCKVYASDNGTSFGREFFPSVFDCTIVERSGR